MATYAIRLNKRNNAIRVINRSNNISLKHTGKTGPTGPKGDKGDPGNDASISLEQLAADPDGIIFGTITRDSNSNVTSAGVIWPDGKTGIFTTTEQDSDGLILAYTVTYGSPVEQTFIQSTMTRDSNGAVIARPAITVI